MTFHIISIDPRDGGREPILNSLTNRPASWPTRATAQAQAANYRAYRRFNAGRDAWAYAFEVIEHSAAHRTAVEQGA